MQTITAPTMGKLRAKFFRGLADPCRLAILDALRLESRSVGELVTTTGRSQSNISNHLSCLLECGLVTRQQQGKFARYSLASERIVALLDLTDDVIESSAEAAEAIVLCARYVQEERR